MTSTNNMQKKSPKQKVVIRGIYYKTEEIKNNYYYHFLLPDIYHSYDADKPSHTLSSLKAFDIKVNEFYDKNIEDAVIFSDSTSVKQNKPIYRDKAYPDFRNFTHFKCKTADKMSFVVGLEYIIHGDMYAYSFIEPETNKNIMGWTIKASLIRT